MKLLLSLLLIISCKTVWAQQYVVSDPVIAAVTQCGVYLDATPQIIIPTAVTEGNICKFGLAGVALGPHTITMTSITVNDPFWGSQESLPSLPLSFVMTAATTMTPVETTTINGMVTGPRSILTSSSSPTTLQNTTANRLMVIVSVGTVTSIEFSRDGSTFDLIGLLSGQFILNPGDYLRITYVVAPTVSYYPI